MKKWDLPKGWEWKNLGSVCEKAEYGYTTSAAQKSSGPRFLRTTDISSGKINWDSVPYCSSHPNNEERYSLKNGDILISRAGSVGASMVITNPPRSVFASYLIRFRPKKGIDSYYLGYFLKSNYFFNQLVSESTGTTLKGVNATNLSRIALPIPPLETQHKIVAILDKAEEIKRLRAEANAQTQKLIQSVFLDMFGDPLTNSKRLPIDKISSISHINPKFGNKFDLSFEVSFIPMSQVEENTGIVHLEFTRKFGEVMKGYTPCQDGDVLFAKITPCMENGKIAIAQGLKNRIGFASTEFHVIRPKDESMKYYLWSILINERIRNLAKERMTGSAGQQRVPSTFIKDLSIPIPKKPDILAFNSQIKKINEIKTQLPSIDDNVGLIFDSFMKTAFKGELVA